ncbi:MAG TPA: helix-turn-helix transcriptional regulator [Actinomycetota bacterium]|nr:helix-turn-helix transcriptional regulator [Actinomycetota bacterium]
MTTHREKLLTRFGKDLLSIRKAAGLTQEQVADRSGLHVNYIGGLERGERNPTMVTLAALAAGLGCDVTDLVSGIRPQRSR